MLGRSLGHYHVVEPIGAGGMGVAYLARDERLNRNVVLKVLPPEAGSDQTARARLVREAQMASALNHPYICTIYEVGEEDGFVFIAMEHIEGRTLASSHSPMGAQEVIRCGGQVAEALEHAHTRGIIHRDLKSTNVMLTSEGRVKVLDFGLAKRLRADVLAENAPTQTLVDQEQAAGTFAYMAPEVLRGTPADERADIWALGVMLYEMSTGQRPFPDVTPYQLTSSILRDDPPPLSSFVPTGLASVILRCLAKEPNQRYQRAGEVRAALEGIQAGAAGAIPHVGMIRQNTRRLAWAASVVLAVVVAAYLYRSIADRTPIRAVAILPFSTSSADAEYLSDGITDNLIDSVARLPDVKVISHSSAFHYKGKEVDPGTVGRELKVGALLTGRIISDADTVSVNVELVNTADNTRLWGERYTRKLSDVIDIQREISQEIGDQLRLHLSLDQRRRLKAPITENSEAYQLFLRGRYYWYKRTPEAYEASRRYYEQAIEKDPAFALAYAGLASYYIQMGDDGVASPQEVFPKAKALVLRALAIDPNLGFGHGILGFVELYDWDFPKAEREFKSAIELAPNWTENYGGYNVCLRAMGRTDEAISIEKRARELDPLSVAVNTSLGWTFYYAHRYAEAIEQFQTSIAMDPNFPSAQLGLANAYQQNGMQKEAIAAWQIYITASGGADLASELGRIYTKYGFRAAMRAFWQAALKSNTEAAKHDYVSPIVFAGLYALLDDKDQAFVLLEKAYEERSTKLLDLKLDPDFATLREDLRFRELVRRVGLP